MTGAALRRKRAHSALRGGGHAHTGMTALTGAGLTTHTRASSWGALLSLFVLAPWRGASTPCTDCTESSWPVLHASPPKGVHTHTKPAPYAQQSAHAGIPSAPLAASHLAHTHTAKPSPSLDTTPVPPVPHAQQSPNILPGRGASHTIHTAPNAPLRACHAGT